jgi:hypothetical protein
MATRRRGAPARVEPARLGRKREGRRERKLIVLGEEEGISVFRCLSWKSWARQSRACASCSAGLRERGGAGSGNAGLGAAGWAARDRASMLLGERFCSR